MTRAKSTRSLAVLLVGVLAAFALAGTRPAQADGDTVDEIHYSFGDTDDTVVFDWHGDETTFYYGPDAGYGQTATAQPSAITPANGTGSYMEVQVSGLQPSSTYHYKIGATGVDHTFQTMPMGDFNWVDIGDTMSTSCHGDGTWMPAQHQLIADQDPTFVTHGGDIAVPNQCGLPSLHQYYVDQQVWSTGAAMQLVLGNHEYGAPVPHAPADAITDSLSNYKGRSFITNGQTVPNDSPKQLTDPGCGREIGSKTNTCQGEDWGWFETGHVLFISYPEPWPNALSDWQVRAGALMAKAQADPDIDFIVTYGHRPPYTSSTEGPAPAIRAATQALAQQYSPTASNPDGKYVLSVGHHAHSMEAFRPINGLTYIIDAAGGQGLTNWVSPVDPNSVWRLMHLGILSAHYSAADHTLTVNMVCGAPFKTDAKGTCTYGTTLYTTTFVRPDTTPPPPQPQIVVSTTDGVASAGPGDQLTYTETVTNTSADTTASAVDLIASVPDGTSLLSADDGVTPTDGSLSWSLGDLAPGQVVTKQFSVQVGSVSPASTITSTAQASTADDACQVAGSSCTATDTDTVPSPIRQWVANQSLESDQTGWTGVYNGSSSVTRVTNDGYDGTGSLQVARTTGSGVAGVIAKPRLVLSTTQGTVYSGSVWVRSQKPGQSISLQLSEVLPTGKVPVRRTATITTPDTGWHPLALSYTASGSGDQLVYSVMSSNLAAGSWFHADDLSLTSPN